jgi:hypothetical protein
MRWPGSSISRVLRPNVIIDLDLGTTDEAERAWRFRTRKSGRLERTRPPSPGARRPRSSNRSRRSTRATLPARTEVVSAAYRTGTLADRKLARLTDEDRTHDRVHVTRNGPGTSC